MVTRQFAEKFEKVLAELKRENVDVFVFAVLKLEPEENKWTVLFSSKDITDEKAREKAFRKLVEKMVNNLDENELNSIARVPVLPPTHPLIKDISRFKKGTYFEGWAMTTDGNKLYDMTVFESKDFNKPMSKRKGTTSKTK